MSRVTDAMNAKDGGPAFPTNGEESPCMSIRDYFAAQAMQALIAEPVNTTSRGRVIRSISSRRSRDCLAREAYAIAQAMLEQRDACYRDDSN